MIEFDYKNKNYLLEDNHRETIIVLIKDLEEKYYRLKKIDLKSLELFNKKTKHKKQIREIRDSLVNLYTILDEIDDDKVLKKIKCPITYNEIILLDYKLKINMYVYFNNLKTETNINKKIGIIKKMKSILRENMPDVSKKECIKLKKVITYLNTLQKEYSKEKIKNVHKEKNTRINNIEKSEDEQELEIDDDPIYFEILNGKNLSSYTLKDIMKVTNEIIRKYEINENLITCIKNVLDRLNSEKQSNECDDLLISILDASKVRKVGFDKKSKEHKILKNMIDILKEYENMRSIYNEKIFNSKDNEFNIIESLLYDENNYPIIKKISIECPNIINSSKNNIHIIEYILKLYLENYEKLLKKQTNNYVNIEYLKEVYLLFTKSPYLRINRKIEDKINKQIYNYIRRLTNDVSLKQIVLDDEIVDTIIIKSDKKKKKIMEETKLLSTHYYNYDTKDFELKKLNLGSLENQINYVSKSAPTCKYNADEKNLFDNKFIVLDNKNISYNIDTNADRRLIRIGVPDMPNLIPKDTSINSYIYNQMLKHESIDYRILEKFEFKNGKDTSCLIYEFLLDKTNKISDFKIYKAKIQPDYNYEDSDIYKELKKMVSKIASVKNIEVTGTSNEKINYIITDIVNNLYLEIATKNKLPITYCGVENINLSDIDLYSKLASLSSKLNKEKANEIHHAITNNMGEFHYSDQPFSTCGNYDLGLFGELNYVYLENQRIIKSLLLNELSLDQEQLAKTKRLMEIEHQNMLLDLNGSIKYKDPSDFDYKKKKTKKKILIARPY